MDPQDQDQNNQTDSLKQQYQDILNKYSKEIKPEPDLATQAAPETQAPTTDSSMTQPASEDSVLPPLPQASSENLLSEVSPEPPKESLSSIPETPVANGAIDEILNQPPQPPTETPPVSSDNSSSSLNSDTNQTPEVPPVTPPTESTQAPPQQTELPPVSPPVESTEPSLSSTSPENTPAGEPPVPPVPPVSPPPTYQTPETPPQDVDAKLSEILDDKPEKPPSSSKFAKTFFFISLIIFLAVVGAIAYNLIKDQSASSIPSNPDKIIVDQDSDEPSVSAQNCVINDQTYSINQSFAAADGCNTCTCQADGTIACTELACELTPSESTPSSLPDTDAESESTPSSVPNTGSTTE
jgi:hypothetical protein